MRLSSEIAAKFRMRLPAWPMPLAVLSQLALFGYYLFRTSVPSPNQDMLDWIASYFDFRDRGGFGAYLWTFHNKHHLIWMRLLVIPDVEWFHASGIAFIVAGTVALLASAAMAGEFIRHHLQGSAALTLAAWLAPMLLLTSVNAADCGVPINTVYPIAAAFMIGCVVLFEGGTNRHRALALLFAMGAAFGNGVGLVIWPALVWLAWRQRLGARWILTVVALGLLFTGLYTLGTPSGVPLAGAPRFDPLDTVHILQLADYTSQFLALPLRNKVANSLTGFALLAVGVFVIVRVSAVERDNTKLNRFAAALIFIAICSAAIAAVGRSHLAQGANISLRYAVLIAPLHIGLLCYAIPGLGRYPPAVWGPTVIYGVAVALVALQPVIVQPVIIGNDLIRAAVAAYYRGEPEPGTTGLLYPDPERAALLVTLLRDRGLLGPR